MKIQLLVLLLITSFLSACGGGSDNLESETLSESINSDAAKSTTQAKTPSNNPLAKEQQLILDAKNLQNILNQDAQEKKKAIEESQN